MSISSALNSAMSGLFAASRASQVISDNIANAMNESYGRRSLILQADGSSGSGVRVLGIQRISDLGLIANRRAAEARVGQANAFQSFHVRFESVVGNPTDTTSISARLAEFESSLVSAASLPDSAQRLDLVAQRALDLTNSLNAASDGLQDLRLAADRSIGQQVSRLNKALTDVQVLNARITAAGEGGAAAAALMDQRQALVDQINEIIPVNIADRPYGQIALYSAGGVTLLDGQAANLEFDTASRMAPQMTIESGLLSGLRVNGSPMAAGPGALRGGSLAAQFDIRDRLGAAAQADLDAVARDLVQRFEDPALDPTRPPGAPGLFTDAGAAMDATATSGLSGRLRLNAIVDPDQSGSSWRLRDGLGAATPGPPGDAQLLQALSDALEAPRDPGATRLGSGAMSAADLVSALTSRVGMDLSEADRDLSFAAASYTEMKRIEQANGVDTDSELQSLIVVEQAFAANARMIEVVDDMMQTILRL